MLSAELGMLAFAAARVVCSWQQDHGDNSTIPIFAARGNADVLFFFFLLLFYSQTVLDSSQYVATHGQHSPASSPLVSTSNCCLSSSSWPIFTAPLQYHCSHQHLIAWWFTEVLVALNPSLGLSSTPLLRLQNELFLHATTSAAGARTQTTSITKQESSNESSFFV